ncbi:GH25 family lysozyme [Lactobacillus sp.]|uniref:SLAP domain-containing protein n=1 Tax=Lactobacillus sp. TaxID=1591 RepID=UPI00199854E3|nr:GH25 family lysozyme [Lactobacillus sp.]MBD5430648.1 lysin [Lactobacillus sp.]
MRSANKKFFSALACAGVMATTAFVGVKTNVINPKAVQVQAAKTNVSSRSYGVDVSSFQSTDLSKHAQAGSQFAIVKVSEGTSYRNPNAKAQIASAISNNMLPMAYHFATFGANSTSAVAEANYAVSSAQAYGLPKGSYIACDWETGDGNNVNGGKDASASAILAFMNKISAAGYKPLLYSGAYLLKSNINTSTILAKYPNSLWVASYATTGRIDEPDFNYFPSMDGVAIWQFTDNWRGLYVDGNISLLPLSYNTASSQAPTSSSTSSSSSSSSSSSTTSKPSTTNTSQAQTTVKTPKTIMYKSKVYNKRGQYIGKYYSAYTPITVIGGAVSINGKAYYQVGDNQYVRVNNVDGTPRTLTHNAYIYNNKGKRTYTLGTKFYKGNSRATFGSAMTINGKSYYRVGKNAYVKVANFR